MRRNDGHTMFVGLLPLGALFAFFMVVLPFGLVLLPKREKEIGLILLFGLQSICFLGFSFYHFLDKSTRKQTKRLEIMGYLVVALGLVIAPIYLLWQILIEQKMVLGDLFHGEGFVAFLIALGLGAFFVGIMIFLINRYGNNPE